MRVVQTHVKYGLNPYGELRSNFGGSWTNPTCDTTTPIELAIAVGAKSTNDLADLCKSLVKLLLTYDRENFNPNQVIYRNKGAKSWDGDEEFSLIHQAVSCGNLPALFAILEEPWAKNTAARRTRMMAGHESAEMCFMHSNQTLLHLACSEMRLNNSYQ